MKKLLLIFLPALSLTVFAQQPNWYNESQRATSYPKNSYFTGIVYGEVQRGENAGKAMERLKNEARAEATKTILVRVQNETTSESHSQSIETIDDWSETIRESMDSKTTTTVDLNIPGMEAEAWKNPSSNEVVAFAYIKKSTLSRQMDKQVTAGLTRIETVLDNAEQLASEGQKTQAKNVLPKVVPLFQEVEQAQRVLTVVDPMSDAESLQLAETKQLIQRYTRLAAELRNGIKIYLSCNAKIFNTNYTELRGAITGELSKMGCTFVNSAAQADWAIYVDASAREYQKNEQMGYYFVYVDALIAVDRMPAGKRIYEEQLEPVKGGWTTNYADAARFQGYKEMTPKIIKSIKAQIQQ